MIDLLQAFAPSDAEKKHHADICALIENHPECFYRTHFEPGHITGSGLLLNTDGSHVLMNYHKSLQKWLCFGGHADGDQDILNVARREIIEESGIENIVQVGNGIFDVDVHPIPENPKKGEPAHNHFDIRFVFRTMHPQDEAFALSDESVALKWCDPAEALALVQTVGMQRLLHKWAEIRQF